MFSSPLAAGYRRKGASQQAHHRQPTASPLAQSRSDPAKIAPDTTGKLTTGTGEHQNAFTGPKRGSHGVQDRLGGHSNSYHSYALDDTLEGIGAAGYKFVELSAVRGWTEHVPLEADAKTLGRIQQIMNKLG